MFQLINSSVGCSKPVSAKILLFNFLHLSASLDLTHIVVQKSRWYLA